MKINTINNNYNNQRQQNFKATVGANFEKGLVSFLEDARPEVRHNALDLLNSPTAVQDFVTAIKNLTIHREFLNQNLSPVINIEVRKHGGLAKYDSHAITANLFGSCIGEMNMKAQPNTNIFAMIFKRAKKLSAYYGDAQAKYHYNHAPFEQKFSNKTIRESVAKLMEALRKADAVETA